VVLKAGSLVEAKRIACTGATPTNRPNSKRSISRFFMSEARLPRQKSDVK
jgi:hypothetical protein